MNIWPTSLAIIGKMMDFPKLKMPEKVGNPKELENYLERDVEVCLQSILHAKKILKECEIKVRRLYTIGQISMSNTLREFKDPEMTSEEFRKGFFADQKSNTVWKSQHPELIKNGYRGATEHAIPGKWKEVDAYDFNGLYQWAATQMEFPNLSSESLTKEPLTRKNKEEIISKIGISRCMIKNESCEHGLLQIRTPKSTYIPKQNKILIGTWTHTELKHAEKNGYKILDIEWSITYEKTENPYKKLVPKLSKKKEEAKTPIERNFWKGIANHGFGKWGQKRTGQEIIIDSIEEIETYKKRNFNMTHGIPGTYMMIYKKEKQKDAPTKSYYAPIIPALINAKARCIMYDYISKIPYNQWLYTGCDSIMTTKKDFHKELPIGSETGQFKTIAWENSMEIIAKKHYKMGKEIKIAGIRTKGITEKDFEAKKLKNKKMITLLNTGDTKQVGKFINEIRDLNEVKEKFQKSEETLEEDKIYIDNDIIDINYFLKNKELQKAL